ncbi:membrane protein of ER body-like protein isoform X2 [Vigna angularis]|uniref:membrane protein of ER body-like protein isoform X2 n=1 Tax=Phaseolus angularis TaxID=3914 RepID=UPI0022B30863|nr:membrane protein of ER body-like protein isoform X2 [Vigna angularis]
MEQLYCAVREDEEKEEQQLQEGVALKGRQSLQQGKDGSITNAEAPSFFSSVGEHSFPQKEEVLHTHKEHTEQPVQKVEETNNVVAENGSNFNGDSEKGGIGIIAEIVENVINGEALSSATINADASHHKNSVYLDQQQGDNIDGAMSALPSNGVNNMEIVDEKVPSSVAELPSPNLTEEIDQQLKEYDVEAVLAKQETHDLFCPNCKSCITKRVILRKRKRTTPIPNIDTKAKRDKSAIEVVDSSVDEGNQGDHAIATPDDVARVEPPADNFEPEREPEVFRCLSCFSFFIPIGNGFKLFPSFGGKPEASQKLPVVPTSNVENPSGVAASNSNWFFTLFTSIKGRKASAQGDASSEDSIADPTSVEDSRIDNPLEIAQNSYSSLMKEAQSPEQSFDSEVIANDVARDKQNFIVNGSIPSIQDLKKVETGIEDEIKPSVANKENEAFETSTSQAAYVPTEGDIVTEAHTEIYIGEQPRAEIGEHQEWEILKSIVYGGLVESITSLGVVSSAASSGSAPLNIIALGLANLIGGLSVIGHNLTDLKNGHSGGNPSQDRYEELLGRRENFTVHAFLAVLSFIIFGSVPLVVYSLLISKHYYDEYNIAAVAASSVVCIILLAMGKAYTSTPPKSYIKTVLHYVSLALATCGVSYIAGDLAKVLLDKISGSESGYVLAMPLSDTTRMEPA